MDETLLTIEELAEQAGVSARTVRFYISEGILPGPQTRGKGASYGEEHLLRLRLARSLAERRVLLADIKRQLAELPLDQVRALLEEEEARAQTLRTAEGVSPRGFLSTLLDQARTGKPETRLWRRRTPPVAAAAEASTPWANLAVPGEETWRRTELSPGVELHVRSDVERRQPDLTQRLAEYCRKLLS